MSLPFCYTTGEVVQVGDIVVIKRRWPRKNQEGFVVYVFDSTKALTPRGDNEFGMAIRLLNGHEAWCGEPDDCLIFVTRGDPKGPGHPTIPE